jgi:hypothetical protein
VVLEPSLLMGLNTDAPCRLTRHWGRRADMLSTRPSVLGTAAAAAEEVSDAHGLDADVRRSLALRIELPVPFLDILPG